MLGRLRILVALLLAVLSCAAADESESIARLIKQLGSERFAEREEASRRLDEFGEAALEQLRKASRSPDAEVRRRARELCAAIDRRLNGELRCLLGHEGEIWSLDVSTDGKRLLSSGADKTPRLWPLEAAGPPRLYPGRAQHSRFPVFSPDGKQALSGSTDRTLRLWDLASGEEVRRFEGASGAANGVAFSADGRRVYSIGGEYLLAWEAASGKRLFTQKVSQPVGLAVSPDGRVVATSGMNQDIHLWDGATGRELRQCKGPTGAVWNVAFSPDSKQLASAGWDGFTRVHDVATGAELRRLKAHRQVYSAVFSPDGRRILTAGADGTVRLWDAATGDQLHCYEGHGGGVWRALFCAGGRRVVSAGADATIRLWAVRK